MKRAIPLLLTFAASIAGGQVEAATPGASANPLTTPALAPPIKAAPITCTAANTFTFAIEKTPPVQAAAPTKTYATFADALKDARAKGACHAILEAGPGTYAESIDVALPHLTIRSRIAPNAVLRGAITNRAGNWLDVRSLVIEHARKTGVEQVGGRLSLTGVRVVDTDTVAGQIDSGIGVRISGGAQVGVRLCTFERNAQAIRAEGDNTRLWLLGVFVTDTNVNPDLRARMIAAAGNGEFDVGAVFLRDRASAWASTLVVQNSDISAINVTHGAKMRLENGGIRKVTATNAGPLGGFGITVRDSATLEWFRSTVTDVAMCGIAIDNAFLTTNAGFITKAPVGACLQPPVRQSTTCLQRGTEYREVGVPLRASSYETPSLTPGAEPSCAHVAEEAPPTWL